MSSLYVTGGKLRRGLFRKTPEWHSCKCAVAVRVVAETGVVEACAEYETPLALRAEENAAILFKSSSVANGKLYTCTSTEVLVLDAATLRQEGHISLPCFNDLHHVCPTPWGSLLVAVTGLDMVVELDADGAVLREWDVLGHAPWQRFSRDIDYRNLLTTKPHQSHPNHVFLLDEEVWVTRFEQRDAMSLTQPGRRIDIRVERPHDGYVSGEWIYFTTVNGNIVVVARETLRVVDVIDLNQMAHEHGRSLGWCRGLAPMPDGTMWVAFSHIRPTRFRENLLWMKHGFEEVSQPTHIALYDLNRRACLREIDMELIGVDVIFSVLPVCR